MLAADDVDVTVKDAFYKNWDKSMGKASYE